MRRLITVAALAAAFLVPTVAQAFHNGEVVIGRFRLPQNHRFESPNAQGKYEVVDINQVPGLIDQGRFVFDRTGNTWIAKPGGGAINAAYLASGSSSTAAAPSGTNQGWQKIHGRVGQVNGSTMTLHADDNRRLTVDMSKVGPEIQKNLQRGDLVTVSAYQVSGNNVRAEYIQKDSSAGVQPPAAQPSAAPSAAVNDPSWQRIHGTPTWVNPNGSQMRFTADDGRALTVDLSEVGPDVQKSLVPGEPMTVIGHFRGSNNTNVAAKFIQKDSSNK